MSLDAREHTERARLALLALQRALARLRLIEENVGSTPELQDQFIDVWDELNKVTQYLSSLNDCTTPVPIFLYN
jgi:hypothetical protein